MEKEEKLTNQELIGKVLQWAQQRDLLHRKNALKQYLKLMEEFGELCGAHLKGNKAGILDAIGDIQVVLIIYMAQLGNEYPTNRFVPEKSPHDIENALLILSTAYGNTFASHRVVKSEDCEYSLRLLEIIADQYDSTLHDCLLLAYNEIKNRTGKTVGGTFIKDEGAIKRANKVAGEKSYECDLAFTLKGAVESGLPILCDSVAVAEQIGKKIIGGTINLSHRSLDGPVLIYTEKGVTAFKFLNGSLPDCNYIHSDSVIDIINKDIVKNVTSISAEDMVKAAEFLHNSITAKEPTAKDLFNSLLSFENRVLSASMSPHSFNKRQALQKETPATKSILKEADGIVNNDRNEQYGDPVVAFSAYCQIAKECWGIDVTPVQLCKLMMSVKQGRLKYQFKRDSIVDLCGYAEILNRLVEHEEREHEEKLKENAKQEESIQNGAGRRDGGIEPKSEQ